MNAAWTCALVSLVLAAAQAQQQRLQLQLACVLPAAALLLPNPQGQHVQLHKGT
jgi:hypothetical protein